jgi:hypothetical protein
VVVVEENGFELTRHLYTGEIPRLTITPSRDKQRRATLFNILLLSYSLCLDIVTPPASVSVTVQDLPGELSFPVIYF